MSTPAILLHDSVDDARSELWFAEPPGFIALPLDALLAEPGSPDGEGLRAAVAPLLDAAPGELARQGFVAQLAQGQQMLAALRRFGTVHCSVGLHRDDVDVSGAATHLLSFLTITWRSTSVAPRAVTAARAVTAPLGHSRIEYVDLPCGPATLSETTVGATPGSGLPQVPLLQVHAHLPHPDCKRMAVLNLGTTALARRGEYRAILRQVAETVRFADPLAVEA
ncbi:hypothetical protein ACIBSR_11485 [Streptomyces sp. NPDC049936]|uniref:hypothetical protein n=1 Tax=Streptomyces sp. NPDC049936 TaxID=3365599 RepID=UPI0037ADE489